MSVSKWVIPHVFKIGTKGACSTVDNQNINDLIGDTFKKNQNLIWSSVFLSNDCIRQNLSLFWKLFLIVTGFLNFGVSQHGDNETFKGSFI